REGLLVQGRWWPARAVVRRNGARRQHRLLPLVQSRRLFAVACRGDLPTRWVNGLRRQEKDTTEPCCSSSDSDARRTHASSRSVARSSSGRGRYGPIVRARQLNEKIVEEEDHDPQHP